MHPFFYLVNLANRLQQSSFTLQTNDLGFQKPLQTSNKLETSGKCHEHYLHSPSDQGSIYTEVVGPQTFIRNQY
jgi:hypothetical protein